MLIGETQDVEVRPLAEVETHLGAPRTGPAMTGRIVTTPDVEARLLMDVVTHLDAPGKGLR